MESFYTPIETTDTITGQFAFEFEMENDIEFTLTVHVKAICRYFNIEG